MASGFIGAIWFMDIFNAPWIEFLDTTVPLNTGFWLLTWILSGFSVTSK